MLGTRRGVLCAAAPRWRRVARTASRSTMTHIILLLQSQVQGRALVKVKDIGVSTCLHVVSMGWHR